MGISLSYFLDTRRMRNDGTYPINMRISEKGKKYIYKIGEGTKENFEAFSRGSNKKGAQDLKQLISEPFSRAESIISNMRIFDKNKFERLYFNKIDDKPTIKTVESLFREMINSLDLEDRIGTRDSYKTTLNSILAFHGKKNSKLFFEDITKDWLTKFEKWLIGKGRSISTVGIYTRTIRSAFNNAIHKGWIDKSFYPFGRRDYKIPATRNVKKALNINQIRLIMNYNPLDEKEEFARDMFILTYLCNGINFKDICLLKYENIGDRLITFNRSKTLHSIKVLEPIKVALLPEIKSIIQRWGNSYPNNKPSDYIFPFLKGGETGIQLRDRSRNSLKKVNKHIKIIAQKLNLGIDDIGTYHSRHSFASVSKNAGISVQDISESLGHSSLAVTKSYLASLEDDQIFKNAKKLL